MGLPASGRGAFFLALLIPTTAAAADITLYVDASSTCTTGCGTLASPFSTIQAAINQANTQIVAGTASSATIQVAAGLYLEHVFIYAGVHVVGGGAASPPLDAAGPGRRAVRFPQGLP